MASEGPPEGRSGRVVLLLVGVLCLLSLGLRWSLAGRLPFVMDELVDTQLAVQVSRGERLYADLPFERMPLMTFLVAAFHDPSAGSVDSVLAARRLFWFVMLVTALGTALVANRLGGWRMAVIALGLLTGFSNFLERAIRIRADSLSTACSIPALFVLLAPRLRTAELALGGLGLGLAWITTQKAVYYVAAFAVALVARHLVESRTGDDPAAGGWRIGLLAARAGAAAAGFFVPFGALLLWAGLRGLLATFLHQTLVYGAQAGLAADTYRGTWRYFEQTLVRNPAFWALGLGGIGGLLALARRRDGEAWPVYGRGSALALACWSASMLIALLQHPSKFPYVFLNVAPALAVCGAVALRRWGPALWGSGAPAWRRAVAGTAAFVLLFLFPLSRHAKAMDRSLTDVQIAIMNRVDRLTEPGDAVFDGIGMAVSRRKATPHSMTARWYDERRAGADYPVIEHLRRTRPKVAIFNYRFRFLDREERAFVQSHFVGDWANVLVVGTLVEHEGPGPTERRVDLLATARYEVLARDLDRVTLDGRPAERRVELSAGPHLLRVEGPPQPVMLRYSPSSRIPRPPEAGPYSLYPSYSR
jgi:hypothetical protein